MYYTIYKTTNKINGKIYIGAHKTKDLDDGYLGSGKILGRAIEKYGMENFEKEILAVFDNKKDMFEMESELVNEDFVEDKETYNLKLGGEGGFGYVNDNGLNIYGKNGQSGYGLENLPKGIKTQKWLRENNPEWFQKFSLNNSKSQKRYYQTHDGKFKGKKHSEEWKKQHSEFMAENQKGSGNSQYGTMWICNIELKESKKIKKTDSIPEGWIKGRNKWIQFQKEQQLNEQKHTERKTRKEQKYKEALHYWNLFKNGNYKSIGEFCKKEYPNNKVYLCKLWKLHISEFNPQKGKPFKI